MAKIACKCNSIFYSFIHFKKDHVFWQNKTLHACILNGIKQKTFALKRAFFHVWPHKFNTISLSYLVVYIFLSNTPEILVNILLSKSNSTFYFILFFSVAKTCDHGTLDQFLMAGLVVTNNTTCIKHRTIIILRSLVRPWKILAYPYSIGHWWSRTLWGRIVLQWSQVFGYLQKLKPPRSSILN